MSGKRLNKIFKTLEECPEEYTGPLPNRFINIKDDTYNFLTVLYLVGFKNGRSEWLCKCNNCNKYVIVNSHNLRTGHTKSCGCLISEKLREDKTGQQYGFLKILKYDCSKNEMPYYIAECQRCGKIFSVCGHSLDQGQISCGCIKSRNEFIILDTLKKQYPLIETEKTFKDCVFKQPLRFDFYIPNKMLIEYDGEQHFHPVFWNGNKDITEKYKNFISNQTRDWYKDFYCIKNNLSLIRIKYTIKKKPTFDDLWNNSITIDNNISDIIDVSNIISSDSINYKNITFTILAGNTCTFKCCKENPSLCQNYGVEIQSTKLSIQNIIQQYDNQSLSTSITFQGPFEILDNIKQLLWFIYYFRKNHNDEIIIWTGYTKEECEDFIYLIKNIMKWENIIIKYGRFIPNQKPHFDEVLGVNLASDNQYAERIC